MIEKQTVCKLEQLTETQLIFLGVRGSQKEEPTLSIQLGQPVLWSQVHPEQETHPADADISRYKR